MAQSLITRCVKTLAVVLLACIVPRSLGSASYLQPPAHAARATVVSTLYEAVSRCGPRVPERDRWRIAGVIALESQRHGYDPWFVLAMVEVESRCVPTARSPRGAVGLMQVKPSVARAVAKETGLRWLGAHALTTPAVNVPLGLRYLAQLEEQFGDRDRAVAAYNLGPSRVAGMSRHHARRVGYVRKVLARYEDLREEYT